MQPGKYSSPRVKQFNYNRSKVFQQSKKTKVNDLKIDFMSLIGVLKENNSIKTQEV